MSKFKVGDRVRVKDTPDIRKWYQCEKAIGYEFLLDNPDYSQEKLNDWQENDEEQYLDKENKYGINYLPSDLELVEEINSNININMKEKFVQMFLKEPEKSFRKAGITNGDGLITSDGQTLLITWLLSKNGEAFKTEVVDGLLAEDKK